eukprot:c6039_g1_i1 orf=269-898(+)
MLQPGTPEQGDLIGSQEDEFLTAPKSTNHRNDKIPEKNTIHGDDGSPGTSFEEQLQECNMNIQESPASELSKSVPLESKLRTGRKGKKCMLLDEDFMEVPAYEHSLWLQDYSDIMKHHKSKRKHPKVAHDMLVRQCFSLPSSSWCWSANGELESMWPSELLDLWECSISGKQKVLTADDAQSADMQDCRGSQESLMNLKHWACLLMVVQ